MPRPLPPPTPGSSSDIRGKEGNYHEAPTFNLPPTAFPEADRASNTSSTPSNNGSDSSYHPVSPGTTTQNSRKRPAQPTMSVITKDDFSLPPPPTRSRKIIQMKPREEADQQPASTGASGKAADKSSGGKKNAGKNSTAAGRKIARKTAHSLIERRRRSKMNEEFGVMKDMIPACQGQDMHKLAILSAGIDYLRYLEQCVTDLQAQNNSPRPPPPAARAAMEEDIDSDDEMAEPQEIEPQPQPQSQPPLPPPTTTTTHTTSHEPPTRTNSLISLPSLSQITTTSPPIFPTTSNTSSSASAHNTANGRHYSISSTSQASYSPYIQSNQTSPAFGPQLSHIPHYTPHFGLGSPALLPLDSSVRENQREKQAPGGVGAERSRAVTPRQGARSEADLDQEATAALLMLNSDRRVWREEGRGSTGGGGGGGMSVRDLLSG